MTLKTFPWDPSEHLDGPEAIAAYLDAAMEDGDPRLITAVLGDIARARGMTEIARETGVTREALYRALNAEGNPEFATVLKVMKAIGLRLSPVPVERKRRPARSRDSTTAASKKTPAAKRRRRAP